MLWGYEAQRCTFFRAACLQGLDYDLQSALGLITWLKQQMLDGELDLVYKLAKLARGSSGDVGPAADADFYLTTCHRMKGLEADHVQLAEDFHALVGPAQHACMHACLGHLLEAADDACL